MERSASRARSAELEFRAQHEKDKTQLIKIIDDLNKTFGNRKVSDLLQLSDTDLLAITKRTNAKLNGKESREELFYLLGNQIRLNINKLSKAIFSLVEESNYLSKIAKQRFTKESVLNDLKARIKREDGEVFREFEEINNFWNDFIAGKFTKKRLGFLPAKKSPLLNRTVAFPFAKLAEHEFELIKSLDLEVAKMREADRAEKLKKKAA